MRKSDKGRFHVKTLSDPAILMELFSLMWACMPFIFLFLIHYKKNNYVIFCRNAASTLSTAILRSLTTISIVLASDIFTPFPRFQSNLHISPRFHIFTVTSSVPTTGYKHCKTSLSVNTSFSQEFIWFM